MATEVSVHGVTKTNQFSLNKCGMENLSLVHVCRIGYYIFVKDNPHKRNFYFHSVMKEISLLISTLLFCTRLTVMHIRDAELSSKQNVYVMRGKDGLLSL